jgi:hypothetical protein
VDEARLAAWLSRGHRAMKETVPPRTRKQLAALMLESKLWNPKGLSMESAIAKVGDCLNPQDGGNQHFRFSELWLWMKESGHHALFEAMADDLGYEIRPVLTEERRRDLLAKIDKQAAAILDGLGNLNLLREYLHDAHAPEPLPPPQTDVPVRFSRDGADLRGF